MEPTVTVEHAGARDAAPPALPRGATLGRYVVLEPLGSGGMGVVYAAFDPELDRSVALKVVHPARRAAGSEDETRQRLAREAQALAQLNHPNVLAVHDVGVVGGQLYVATELVEGCDLTAWLRGASRTRREILDVFLQAGAGIAAAHATGLVHRDLKLSNIMMGNDGRVRVVDFGLASSSRPPVDGGLAVGHPASVIGTPTYAAPEQLAGQPVTAAADQFGFCVSLYRALCDGPPFPAVAARYPGDAALWTLDEGPLTALPASLRRLLRRGLHFTPEARYPSMNALLDDLKAIHGQRRRRRRLAGLVAVAGGAAAAVALAFSLRQQAVCSGGEGRFATVWNADRKHAIATAFTATGLDYAQASWRGVERILDRYATQWATAHDAACRATTVEGTQSDELLDLRMACLDRRLREVDALADRLQRGHAVAEHAVSAAGALAPVGQCADTHALLATTAPPASPSQAQAIGRMRQHLAAVEAQLLTADFTEGLARAQAVVAEAESVGYWPLTAEALLVQARFEASLDRVEAADRSLESALDAAQAGGHDRIAAEAFVRRVRVAGYQQADFERGIRYARQAEAALARLAHPDVLTALLAGNRGAMLVEQGDFNAALDAHREALAIWTRVRGPLDPRTGVAMARVGDVLLEQGELALAAQRLEGALSISRNHHGDSHPLTARLLSKVGTVRMEQGQVETARPYFEQALAASRATLPADHPYLATPLTYLGHALVATGAYDEATRHYREAMAVLERSETPDLRRLSVVASGLARAASAAGDDAMAADYYGRALGWRESVYGAEHPAVAETAFNLGEVAKNRGDHTTALRRYRQALAIWQTSQPDNDFLLAVGLTGVGEALLALGDAAAALPMLERALRRHPSGRDGEFLATTQFTLARALMATGGDRARAHALAITARDAFAGGRAAARDEVARVDAWLADPP